ncbi:Golgi SNAP receptor complex member 1 [Porphyridium purpureum]|uniref:Golgi SNAP receptor complex member 1 n=1 Tax=Porphyridium purpureum TaxID=35688 RepID=A0A5J4YRG2_PORPP|nr:Golgi SNAP receptor complex member 1 [Porphyridium purpureum]|eukprot:POR4949..scf229_5
MASAAAGGAPGWDALRKEARLLENELDDKLVAYGRMAVTVAATKQPVASVSGAAPGVSAPSPAKGDSANAVGLTQRRAGGAADAAEAMVAEIEALLERLSDVVDRMGALASPVSKTGEKGANVSSGTPSNASIHAFQRHSEILSDFRTEFRRTKSTIKVARDRMELVSGSGISANGSAMGGAHLRASAAMNAAGPDALHAERAALVGASASADSAIEKSVTLRDELERQRSNFASMMSRMEEASGRFPVLNRLIGQLKRKKRRDMYVLAAVVSILAFLTVLWKLF